MEYRNLLRKRKFRETPKFRKALYSTVAGMTVFMLLVAWLQMDVLVPRKDLFDPSPNITVNASEMKPTMTPMPTPSIDLLVGKYVDKYAKGVDQKSLLRATMHCLLYKESKHNQVDARGDSGMASGPLQFWDETWSRMRKQMKREGIIENIGIQTDLEDAIETTVWALVSTPEKTLRDRVTYANEWGPIKRGECIQ